MRFEAPSVAVATADGRATSPTTGQPPVRASACGSFCISQGGPATLRKLHVDERQMLEYSESPVVEDCEDDASAANEAAKLTERLDSQTCFESPRWGPDFIYSILPKPGVARLRLAPILVFRPELTAFPSSWPTPLSSQSSPRAPPSPLQFRGGRPLPHPLLPATRLRPPGPL